MLNTHASSERATVLVLNYPQVQLFQLLSIDTSRCIDHQIGCGRSLRKRDHIAHVVRPGQDHHQTIDSRGDADMRRSAILECVEKEPETLARFIRRHSQRLENESLHVASVNTNRSAGHLDTIDDRVVCLRTNLREQVCLTTFNGAFE